MGAGGVRLELEGEIEAQLEHETGIAASGWLHGWIAAERQGSGCAGPALKPPY